MTKFHLPNKTVILKILLLSHIDKSLD